MSSYTYRLGVNHHLLFPESMADAAVHEHTLAELLAWPEFAIVDCYTAGDAAQRRREAAMLSASGKGVVYNSPLYYTMPGCEPNATDTDTIARTRDAALPHLDAAADSGALRMAWWNASNWSSGLAARAAAGSDVALAGRVSATQRRPMMRG